jgi:hypothetical protein
MFIISFSIDEAHFGSVGTHLIDPLFGEGCMFPDEQMVLERKNPPLAL